MTIYDIAKEAGTSASTVSRVINRKPGVNPQTRQRVLELLEQYNYSPNAMARGLVNQASKLIGVLVGDIRTIHHTDSAYYIEREMEKMGYCCIIVNTGEDMDAKANAIMQLERYRVEGAILIGSTFQSLQVQQAIEMHLPHIPIVIVNGYLELKNVYGVLSDERNGVERCVRYMAERGHDQLAFIRESNTPSSQLKVQGFINGQILQGKRQADCRIFDTGPTLQDGYDITRRILDEHPEINGLIFSVDLLAAGSIHALSDRGISVPGQVAVIGIDNSIYGEICNPKITSLDNKMLESSILAAHMMIDHLEGRPSTVSKMILPSEIVPRESA